MKTTIDQNVSQYKDVIEVINPATKEVIDTVPLAKEEDIEKALHKAVSVKKSWAATPVWKRAEIFNRFADSVDENKEQLANLLCLEAGKPIAQAEAEIETVSRLFRAFPEKAKHLYGVNIPLDHQAGIENDVYLTRREPLGVIVGIIPFNYPADVFSHKVAPALITGNVIIVKPPAETPLTILKLGKLFYESGLPEGVLQVINGSGRIVGQKLVSSPLVNGVSLTGGTDTGIQVAASAIKHLNPVMLELGGSDPFIVFDDVDIDYVVEEAVAGRIAMNGQTCIANKRMIIHSSRVEEFTEKLVSRVKKLKYGNPIDRTVDIGPLINEKALQTVHEQVHHTVKQGAVILTGGNIVDNTWYLPTVLSNVKPEFDIAKDLEVFGPVFPIIQFDNEEEAVSIANSSCYGLNASIFTNDVNRAMNISYQIESGIVAVNGSGVYRPDVSYFGGYKMSGYAGNEGLIGALEGMTQIKSVALRNCLNIYQ